MQRYSVKQFCDMVGVPFSTLRYYERIGLLNPDQDKKNKYRKYSLEDAFKVNKFKRYRSLGFTVDEVVELITCSEPTYIVEKINHRQQAIGKELQELEQKYKRLEQFKKNIFITLEKNNFKVVKKEDKFFLAASEKGVFNATTYDEFSKWVEHLPITTYCKVINQESLVTENYVIDYGISIDKSKIYLLDEALRVNAKRIKLGECICFYTLIDKGQIADNHIFKELDQFLQANNLVINGDFYLEGVPVKREHTDKKVSIVWVSVKEK